MKAPLHSNYRFDPIIDPHTLDDDAWLMMSEEEFSSLASSTPMTRAGLHRIQGNVKRGK